jgi:surface antigen
MVGSFGRLAAAAALCLIAAGCASSPDNGFSGGDVASPDNPLQCVPYARAHSNVALYGDAYTWWDQAEGRYAKSNAPSEGAVMVLFGYAGPERAHVAVVRQVVNTREIRVDHANWLDDGDIYTDDPVRDVSPDNDWSLVKVFNLKNGAWGSKAYPVQGFIGPGAPGDGDMRLASSPPPAATANDPIGGLIAADATPVDDDN